MSQKPSKQPSTNGGEGMNSGGIIFFVIAGLLYIGALALWSRFHTEMSAAYGGWRQIQLFLFHLVGGTPLADWFTFFKESDPALVGFSHWTESSLWANGVGFLFVVLPFAIHIARRSIKTNPFNEHHFAKPKDYTIESFSDCMAHEEPHLKLFRKLDLVNKPINSGKYRMPDTEKQFAINNDLVDGLGDGYAVSREAAAAKFSIQLGRMWAGISSLTIHEYAVMAVCLPRIAALDTKLSDEQFDAAIDMSNDIIEKLWHQASDSYDIEGDTLSINIEPLRVAFDSYFKHPSVQAIFKRHAYIYTILFHMIGKSREVGVLAPAELRWLRVVDRQLWIVVDTVGRLTPFTESAGVHAHYLYELNFKRALEKPHVDNAAAKLASEFDKYKLTEAEIAAIEANLLKKTSDSNRSMRFGEQPDNQVMFLGLRVTSGVVEANNEANLGLIEACIVDIKGKQLLPLTLCKPKMLLSPEQERSLGVSNLDLAERTDSDSLIDQIRKICARQIVIAYDMETVLRVVPGLERAANELYCASNLFKATQTGIQALTQLNEATQQSLHSLPKQLAMRALKVAINTHINAYNDAILATAIWALHLTEREAKEAKTAAKKTLADSNYIH